MFIGPPGGGLTVLLFLPKKLHYMQEASNCKQVPGVLLSPLLRHCKGADNPHLERSAGHYRLPKSEGSLNRSFRESKKGGERER